MKFTPDNPCYGCQVTLPTGEARRSACCWDVVLIMSNQCFISYFQDIRKNGEPLRTWTQNDLFMGEQLLVEINDACPHLDQETGACGIEVEAMSKAAKPYSCQKAQPEQFDHCAYSPQGRDSQFARPRSNSNFLEGTP